MSSPSRKMSTAAISQSTRRARGRPAGRRSRPASVATHSAAAPSVSGEALPAVIVPASRSKAGFSFASFSTVVSARGMPSRVASPAGITRSSKKPDGQRLHGALVRGEGEPVLRLARDLPRLRHLLAVLAHAPAGGAVLHARHVQLHVGEADLQQPVDALAHRARLGEAPQPVREPLRERDLHAAHALHAAHERELVRRRPASPPPRRPRPCWSSTRARWRRRAWRRRGPRRRGPRARCCSSRGWRRPCPTP